MTEPFPARYSGTCDPCGDDIKQGDMLRNHPDSGWVHEDCYEDVGAAPQSNGAAFDSFNRGRAPIAVLPRGKTASDRCDTCFQVPATNGTCGCDS